MDNYQTVHDAGTFPTYVLRAEASCDRGYVFCSTRTLCFTFRTVDVPHKRWKSRHFWGILKTCSLNRQ